jgi:hypothetical protein
VLNATQIRDLDLSSELWAIISESEEELYAGPVTLYIDEEQIYVETIGRSWPAYELSMLSETGVLHNETQSLRLFYSSDEISSYREQLAVGEVPVETESSVVPTEESSTQITDNESILSPKTLGEVLDLQTLLTPGATFKSPRAKKTRRSPSGYPKPGDHIRLYRLVEGLEIAEAGGEILVVRWCGRHKIGVLDSQHDKRTYWLRRHRRGRCRRFEII